MHARAGRLLARPPSIAARLLSRHCMTDGTGFKARASTAPGYWTLAEPYVLEQEVKKSRFIAHVWPVTSAAQAQQLIGAASDPGASHNCYAYKVGAAYRSSDDGEPGGTAGRPILGAIEGDGLDGVAALVVRHFGGVKLGSGGLVRAYGGAARDCLRAAPKQFVHRRAALRVAASFATLGTVYNVLSRFDASPAAEDYGASGSVSLTAEVQADRVEALQQALSDATSGRVTCSEVGEPATVAAAAGDAG